MLPYLVFVGALFNIVGVVSYAVSTYRGKTKPNRVTWLMWSIAPLIGSAAAIAKGVGLAAVPVFMAGASPFLVFLISFANPHAYWKLGRFDYLCGSFSILALVLWGITNEPNLAIIFAILSDVCAAIPTLMKAWKFPETESSSAYLGGLLSNVTAFAAMRIWAFPEYAFVVYLMMQNMLLLIFINRRKFS